MSEIEKLNPEETQMHTFLLLRGWTTELQKSYSDLRYLYRNSENGIFYDRKNAFDVQIKREIQEGNIRGMQL